MSEINSNIGESLVHISANRTLIVTRLTSDEVVKPEIVQGLQTLQQVFEHYQPTLAFRFEDARGFTQAEELKFKTLMDFSWDSIASQSRFLTRQTFKKRAFLKAAGQIQTNSWLKAVLTDVNKRRAFETMVKQMSSELKK